MMNDWSKTMPTIESQIELVKTLASSISARAGSLTPEQMALPSACDQWQVQDVVAHLIGGANRQIEGMTRGRDGDSGPPQGFTSVDSTTTSVSNSQRDMHWRENLGDGLLAAFDDYYAQLYEVLDTFHPDGWDTLCWHMRRGPMPAWEYIELRIQELAIHDWDMRKALEPDPTLHPGCIETLLSFSMKWLAMCFRPGERLETPVVYEFDLAPPHETSIIIRVNGDSFDMPSEDEAPERWTVCGEAPAFLLFIYGRITGREAIAANEFAITGDPGLLDQFEAWFRGV